LCDKKIIKACKYLCYEFFKRVVGTIIAIYIVGYQDIEITYEHSGLLLFGVSLIL
jgi:hypothetical protein